MTNAEILKPLVQMMMDVSNGKGQFEKTDLEVISANAVAIQAIIAQDSGISARQAMDMWNAARQAGKAESIDIDVPKSVEAASSRGRFAPGAFESTVGGTPYEEIAKKAKKTEPRERY
jgi:hypothetical protein